MRDWSVMTTSRIELEAVKAAALAKGFDWADSQQWYEGHLEAGIIVAPTDQAPGSDPMRTGPARVRRELTVVNPRCLPIPPNDFAILIL